MSTVALPSPIQEFIDATNGSDSERFVAAFAEDAYLNDWGREFNGRNGIRDWDRTDNIGKKAHFEVVNIAFGPSEEAYVVTVKVTGNGYNGTSPLNFVLRDGRIAELRIN